MVIQVFGVMTPVMICVLIGVVWARSGRGFDTRMVSALITNVGAPCLIVSTLGQVSLSRQALVQVAGLFALTMAVTLLVAWAALRITARPGRIFLPSLIFPNVGNMGLPLCMLAFGKAGLALALAWFMLTAILQFSLGTLLVSGRPVGRTLFTNPIVVSVGLAVLLVVTRVALPGWLSGTVDLLAGMTIPLMLITLGVSLARLRVSHLQSALFFSVLRLGLGFGAAWLAVTVLGIQGPLRGVALVQSSMPVAVFNYLFAERYGQGPGEVAGMVVLSTVLSFLTLPWLLAFALG